MADRSVGGAARVAVEAHDVFAFGEDSGVPGVERGVILGYARDGYSHADGHAEAPFVRCVFAGAVQRAFAEDEEFARLQFHIDRAGGVESSRVGHFEEGHLFGGALVRKRLSMRAGDDLYAGILDRGPVDGDPGGSVYGRLKRPEVDVLMPGDFGAARRFVPEVGGPDDQIRPQNTGDAVDDSGIGGEVVDDRLIHVAGLAARTRVGTVAGQDVSFDAAADIGHFSGRHGGVGAEVAIFEEEVDFGAG